MAEQVQQDNSGNNPAGTNQVVPNKAQPFRLAPPAERLRKMRDTIQPLVSNLFSQVPGHESCFSTFTFASNTVMFFKCQEDLLLNLSENNEKLFVEMARAVISVLDSEGDYYLKVLATASYLDLTVASVKKFMKSLIDQVNQKIEKRTIKLSSTVPLIDTRDIFSIAVTPNKAQYAECPSEDKGKGKGKRNYNNTFRTALLAQGRSAAAYATAVQGWFMNFCAVSMNKNKGKQLVYRAIPSTFFGDYYGNDHDQLAQRIHKLCAKVQARRISRGNETATAYDFQCPLWAFKLRSLFKFYAPIFTSLGVRAATAQYGKTFATADKPLWLFEIPLSVSTCVLYLRNLATTDICFW